MLICATPMTRKAKKTIAKKREVPLPVQILQKIAPRIGASISMEPNWQTVGQITFKNGKKSYFWNVSFDINPLGACVVADDKDYASFFMERMGYRVVPSKAFYSKKWSKVIGVCDQGIDEAYDHAEKIGWPVIVKPNSQAQGRGVSLVHNKKDFYETIKAIFKHDKIALVQRALKGKDYRIVVLDDRVISAYERSPLCVVGDGILNIKQLLKKKQKAFTVSGRDTIIDISDGRMKTKLKHQGYTFESVPKNGEKVFLLDSANLSTGGDGLDVTESIHPDFKKMAIKLTKDMGLRLCGVDIMVDGDITKPADKYWILEINETPGLDHYIKIGPEQAKIVEDLYLEVLKGMEN